MRRLFAPALLMLSLAACGSGDEPADAPATPTPVALSAEQKTALMAALPAPYDAGDLENGARAFARCRSCHTITPNGPNMTGPNLYGVFARQAGTHVKYNYSPALKAAGFAWDAERLDHWLQNPRTFLPGNKMTFPGLPDATDRRDVIAFLKVETGYAPAAQ
ncbi:MAG: cytochrome c family protein [Brevundimonas sp.]|uniref:c-type cytochrome n=1 Tax=Brevundimonas sp. TaxID=1871086 RepID=UPI00120A0502|nr:cytochrome c family protein [Brevundimonas sp.]RZJ19458.1 MAG: cytochrome c family protein [Brevundimonas sp.]